MRRILIAGALFVFFAASCPGQQPEPSKLTAFLLEKAPEARPVSAVVKESCVPSEVPKDGLPVALLKDRLTDQRAGLMFPYGDVVDCVRQLQALGVPIMSPVLTLAKRDGAFNALVVFLLSLDLDGGEPFAFRELKRLAANDRCIVAELVGSSAALTQQHYGRLDELSVERSQSDPCLRLVAAWLMAHVEDSPLDDISGRANRAKVLSASKGDLTVEDGWLKTVSALTLVRAGELNPRLPRMLLALPGDHPLWVTDIPSAFSNLAEASRDAEACEMIEPLREVDRKLGRNTRDWPEIRRTVKFLELLPSCGSTSGLSALVARHWVAVAVTLVYVAVLALWYLLYCFCPLRLLAVSNALGSMHRLNIGPIEGPLEHLLLLRAFLYRPRVLDAWVDAHLETARKSFIRRETVETRSVYVSAPVRCDSQMLPSPSAKEFQQAFDRRRTTVLIVGEGGIGKTTLACQMALWGMQGEPEARLNRSHRMLPILIEEDWNAAKQENESRDEDNLALLGNVRGQLTALIESAEPVPETLFRNLVSNGRILVIVDSFSERGESSRRAVSFASPTHPVGALVVTSRIRERLDDVPKIVVEPARIEGTRLSVFMDEYLRRRAKRDLFSDTEYFEACAKLADMIGDRDMTPLLAKLYAEQMIASKESPAEKKLPESIPDLMLSYLNEVNRSLGPGNVTDREIHRLAKVVARECIKREYRPTPASRVDVLTALGNDESAEPDLDYLENRLRLIQTIGAAKSQIKFSLDPLAEYLAADQIVEQCRADEAAWKSQLQDLDAAPGAPESIKSFILALRDCCIARRAEIQLPAFVPDELARKAGVDPDALRKAHAIQRLQRLIAALQYPHGEDRIAAADALRKLGKEAQSAIGALVDALTDEDGKVRAAVVKAIKAIHPNESLVPRLTELLHHHQRSGTRAAAAEVLAMLGNKAKPALPDLIEAVTDVQSSVAQHAADGIGAIGPDARNAVPVLISAFRRGLKLHAGRALGRIGSDARAAVSLLIEALEDHSQVVEFDGWADDSSFGFMKTIEIRVVAAGALAGIGPDAKDAVPALSVCLSEESRELRLEAARALGCIGPAAAPATANLAKLVSDRELFMVVAGALARIGPGAADAVPQLIQVLSDQDPSWRRQAAWALGEIGPQATGAVPLLENLTDDVDSHVKAAANHALHRIHGGESIA